MTCVMNWDEWAKHDAVALAERVRSGDVTPTELAQQAAAGIAQVNDALTAMKKDGTTARVHAKWFGTLPPADSSTVKVLDMPK